MYFPLKLEFAFQHLGVRNGSQNDTNLLKPRVTIISKLKIKAKVLWKVVEVKIKQKQEVKKKD